MTENLGAALLEILQTRQNFQDAAEAFPNDYADQQVVADLQFGITTMTTYAGKPLSALPTFALWSQPAERWKFADVARLLEDLIAAAGCAAEETNRLIDCGINPASRRPETVH